MNKYNNITSDCLIYLLNLDIIINIRLHISFIFFSVNCEVYQLPNVSYNISSRMSGYSYFVSLKNQSTLVKKEKKHTHTLEVFVFCQQLKESTDRPIDTLFLQYNYDKKKKEKFYFLAKKLFILSVKKK